MTGPLFIKTQIIDYENDASDIECKINWSSLRWILFIYWQIRWDEKGYIDVGDKMCWLQVSIAKMSLKSKDLISFAICQSPKSLWSTNDQNNTAI